MRIGPYIKVLLETHLTNWTFDLKQDIALHDNLPQSLLYITFSPQYSK